MTAWNWARAREKWLILPWRVAHLAMGLAYTSHHVKSACPVICESGLTIYRILVGLLNVLFSPYQQRQGTPLAPYCKSQLAKTFRNRLSLKPGGHFWHWDMPGKYCTEFPHHYTHTLFTYICMCVDMYNKNHSLLIVCVLWFISSNSFWQGHNFKSPAEDACQNIVG